ncbi:MBL fold metallo-hydrolase [Pseudomonadales bacterium]|jgi:ribonuclease BN (tRNA processing enzyme)|nr:MBL fold metallo-hydrolase [Pseudomonadales bacterium]|tara:strand:+ start:444 stop:1277 length:834 start_codon:yes stop_codon:yes gene_type:complete
MNVTSKANLGLTNDGELSLFFIGVGSAFSKNLNQTNALIVKGDDHLLIDCGTRCSQSLHEYGIPITGIQNFLITHSHADHIGGLEEVHLHGRYVQNKKPNMVIAPEYEQLLWSQSLRGGSEMSESTPLKFRDLWHVIEPKCVVRGGRDTWEANVGSINIKLPRTMHYPDTAPSWRESFWSTGVIIDDKLLFTSDTRFDPEFLETFDREFNFDFIFHDCQLFTGGVHSSIEELMTLPAELKRKILLMHYGDNWKDFEKVGIDAGFHAWVKQGHTYTIE